MSSFIVLSWLSQCSSNATPSLILSLPSPAVLVAPFPVSYITLSISLSSCSYVAAFSDPLTHVCICISQKSQCDAAVINHPGMPVAGHNKTLLLNHIESTVGVGVVVGEPFRAAVLRVLGNCTISWCLQRLLL